MARSVFPRTVKVHTSSRLPQSFGTLTLNILRRANLDVYNALNDGAILTINNNYGASWLLPSGAIHTAQTIQVGGRLTF